jgi:lipid II:glycine glycyltransferase (peptidoglycan interpeptide bridge formation enzyme)
MLSIFRKKRGLICRDVYFASELPEHTLGEDIQYFIQADRHIAHCETFSTSIIDLRKSEKDLFKAITSGFSYQIRRAIERDNANVIVLTSPNKEDIDKFISFYDQFAPTKSLSVANREKLIQLAASCALTLSISTSKKAGPKWLSAHAYICDGKRARLLYSARNTSTVASSEKNLAGRINKYMHWHIMLHFKSKGYEFFDFGGLSRLEGLNSLNQFKEAFGGRRVIEYNCVRGITKKGKVAALLFRIQNKLMSHSK